MTVIIALLLAPLIVLTSCFAVEILVGLRPLGSVPACSAGRSAVIIVPAHDEAPILEARLAELKDAARGHARILVVADNCSDRTAEIARSAGVETIERFDPDRRGKGFALDFAKNHLKRNPPDVVLIVDADCRIDGQSLKILIGSCAATGRPCQATNLQIPSADASPAVQLSTFAFFIRNVIRQRALQRLAGRANLLGTGMALPWPIFETAELSTSDIVEDLKLGQELAETGHAPLFVEQATIWSDAETESNTLSQRSRWEGGFLRNALRVGPSMLGRSLLKRDVRGFWAAINAMIPPFALLIVLDLAMAATTAAAIWFTAASYSALLLLIGSLLLTFLALGLALRAGGFRFVSVDTLLRAPLYILWKLPMYLAFARGGAPNEWQRTDRK